MRKKIIIWLFSILKITLINAQLTLNSSTFNFGKIEKFNNDTAYFIFENTGSKTIYLLPTQPKDDYQILTTNKQILSNEKMSLAVVYYTNKKGNFTLDIPIYFSHITNPITVTLKGNILSINETAFNTCPSIENSTSLNNRVPLDIIVKDFETNVIIQNSVVEAERKRSIFNCIPGLGNKSYQCNCDYGKLNLSAKKEGYLKGELTFDYSENNHYAIIYLKKSDTILIEKKIEIITNKIDKKDSIKPTKKIAREIFKNDEKVVNKIDTLSKTIEYKPNHLVFIIDVSNSMKDSNKLAYLKQSIKALINELRAKDYITLITYTARQKIIFENISGAKKFELISAIDSLKAGGGSYGADAMILGYELAKKNYIDGGNNQLFIATDGIFNGSKLSEDDLYKIVKKQYNKNGIKLSTIGFGNYMPALNFLSNLAQNGNGQSLKIQQLPQDNNVLIEEVKKQSLIN